MVMCFAPDCKHYSERKTCKFFTFPANPNEKRRWISLIRRKDRDPSQYSLVCSCHFINQDRKNGPTIFEFRVKKTLDFPSPEKRKPTVKKAKVETVTSLTDEQVAGPSNAPLVDPLEQSSIETAEPTATFLTDEQIAGPSNAPDVAPLGQSRIETNEPSCSRSAIKPLGASLKAENYFLKKDLEEAREKLKNLSSRFSWEHIKNNDSHVLMYTGIPSKTLFLILYETMDSFNVKYYAGWNVKLLPKIDQILMTLMKLRLNLPHEDLALRFGCSAATVTNIIMTWMYALHEVLFNQLMKTIPSRQKNQACLPAAFSSFKNCRIILDCTELYSAVPTSMETQRLTYSSYKHRNTWKVLVGVSPNGVITFVSKAYPGSSSEKNIVEHCDVLKQMVSGDLILADKGFLIKDLLPEGVSLNIPPFLTTPQFTESQVFETERIAKARIHVERAIRKMKGFSILNHVPKHYISQISIIVQLCAALTNFQYPLIKEVEEYYC